MDACYCAALLKSYCTIPNMHSLCTRLFLSGEDRLSTSRDQSSSAAAWSLSGTFESFSSGGGAAGPRQAPSHGCFGMEWCRATTSPGAVIRYAVKYY